MLLLLALLPCLQYVSTYQRSGVWDEEYASFFGEEPTFSENFEKNRILNPMLVICLKLPTNGVTGY
jgi:hypothetical protein